MSELGRKPGGDASFEQQVLFPIREVSRLTGVNAVTLRAWERRYGLIQPIRTDSGHRLYSQGDVDDIRSVLGWLERGVAVSKVGSILARSQALAGQATRAVDSSLGWQQQVRLAVQRFDLPGLGRLYEEVFAASTLDQVFAEVFMPVWHDLAVRHGGYGQTSEWLFFDQFLRGRVFTRLQLAAAPRRHNVLLVPLPGQCHELELLVTSLLLGSDEVGVTPLVCGQPLQELALVCERMKPDALVLFSHQPLTAEVSRYLKRLASVLGCALLLAGEATDQASGGLAGSPLVCLGAQGGVMRQRLRQCLAGQLDT
ncbi:helix-turn-helix-type transcriptional regulator [Pseudomonas putida]|nr:helix-turn-helix-type transcriptional regulator [Pseudomonas putida]